MSGQKRRNKPPMAIVRLPESRWRDWPSSLTGLDATITVKAWSHQPSCELAGFEPKVAEIRRGSCSTTVFAYASVDLGCLLQIGPILGGEDLQLALEIQRALLDQGWDFVCQIREQ